MQRLLLDTNAIIWMLTDSARLGPVARAAIGNRANEVFLSAASVWEIALKRFAGRIELPPGLYEVLEATGVRELPVTFFHAEHTASLPPVHRDPFDRLLVAQAQAEGLTIVTSDGMIPRYPVRTMRADR